MSGSLTEEEKGWLKIFGIPIPEEQPDSSDEPKLGDYAETGKRIQKAIIAKAETIRWLSGKTGISKEELKGYIDLGKVPPPEHEEKIFAVLGLSKED